MLERGHSVTGLPLKTAGGISLVALGALAGYAVGSGPAGEQPSAATAKRPVEVRTQTIRRTVRIVKRERPKHDRPDPATTVAPAAPAAPAAAQQATPATAVAPQPALPADPTSPGNSTPVRTRTSGAGPAGGEREHAEEHDRGEREGRDD
jgi:hypothetical protein